MHKEIALTPRARPDLEEELRHLETVRRREVGERIKEAKEFGDISENSEYDDAKNEQAWVESRIAEINQILAHATIIESPKKSDKVSSAPRSSCRTSRPARCTSTSSWARPRRIPRNDRISQRVAGRPGRSSARKKGETVDVTTPSGKVLEYEVVSITTLARWPADEAPRRDDPSARRSRSPSAARSSTRLRAAGDRALSRLASAVTHSRRRAWPSATRRSSPARRPTTSSRSPGGSSPSATRARSPSSSSATRPATSSSSAASNVLGEDAFAACRRARPRRLGRRDGSRPAHAPRRALGRTDRGRRCSRSRCGRFPRSSTG